MDQISFVEVLADFMQVVSHNEIAMILLQKPVSYIDQFFVWHTTQQFESNEFRFWTDLFDNADDFRRSLHMDNEIVDI